MLYAGDEKVIVEVLKNDNVSEGGIVIPENAVKNSNKGVVVDSELYDEGTIVYFKPYSGFGIHYKDRDYLVVFDEDILAYIESESDDDDMTDL